MVDLHNSLLAMNRVNLTEPFISFEVFFASNGSNNQKVRYSFIHLNM